jgi:hypothetical protein
VHALGVLVYTGTTTHHQHRLLQHHRRQVLHLRAGCWCPIDLAQGFLGTKSCAQGEAGFLRPRGRTCRMPAGAAVVLCIAGVAAVLRTFPCSAHGTRPVAQKKKSAQRPFLKTRTISELLPLKVRMSSDPKN